MIASLTLAGWLKREVESSFGIDTVMVSIFTAVCSPASSSPSDIMIQFVEIYIDMEKDSLSVNNKLNNLGYF